MKKVLFSVSMNIQGALKKETFTFEQLGIDENISEDNLEETLQEKYNEWLWDHIYGGFEVKN